nr:hypothetical protein [Tanacetum cinerariifolium]
TFIGFYEGYITFEKAHKDEDIHQHAVATASVYYCFEKTDAEGIVLAASMRVLFFLSATPNCLDSQVSDKSKAGLGNKEITPDSFVNSSEILEKQENRSDKEYHAVLPHFTRNYIPPKRDLRLIDEHFESVYVISNIAPSDVKTVKTIDVNHKGVFSTEEPKPVMKNNFSSPIIEDWYSDDESKVEISPTVEVNIVKPSVDKIKLDKTAKETVKTKESPKEARLKLKELIELCTKLSDRVLDLEKTKTAQAKEIADLKKRVKKLERKGRSRTLRMNLFKIGTSRRRSLGKDDASKQGRNLKQRPNIQFSTCLYARYQANPKESYLIVVKRIFRYLTGRKLVCWSAKKQHYVAMSLAEVEYVTAAGCCANILWMKSQLTDYHIIYEKVSIFYDNTSAIAISNNLVLLSRTKQIDIRYHFIKDHILKGGIELHVISTKYQLADIFTKPLDEPTFKRLIVELGGIRGEIGITTFRNALRAYYLPHSNVPVDFQAPRTSLQSEKVPQGKKPRAKSRIQRKQSSKHTSESKTEASKSKTSQSDKENQSSSAKDKSQIHPSPSTPMVGEIHKETQQAADGPTSLGSNGCDALADSTIKVDPGKSAPNDSIPSQQEKQENRSDKEYHAVLPPFTRNYIPSKRDLRLIDEHFKSVYVISNIAPSDVKTIKTIDVNHKGVFSTEEPKPVMKNNFSSPIIEDWYSDDESEVEISPTVEVNIVKPSVDKIKLDKTARKTVKTKESPNKEARLKLKELIELCTKLSDRVLDLEKTKTAQAKEIANLKKRVKKLERKRRSRTLRINLFKIGTSRRRSLGEDDASKQGRNLKQRGGLLGLKDFLVLLKLLLLVMVSTAAGMLTRAMTKELSVALAHEYLFVDFFSEEPKKVSEVLQHPEWANAMQDELNSFSRTRPNIQFSTCLYARYQANPKESYLIVVKRIFRYLTGGKLVCWSAKKQHYVAMSLAEVEYVTAAGCCANILWMKSQLTDYHIIYEKVSIFCDNTSAIAISNNLVLLSRTKQIDIRYHFIKDHILKGGIELHVISTKYQLADIFTKPLDEPTFKRLIVELDVPVDFQAPKTSSQSEKVPQGKKPRAKSRIRRKQSSKHTSESKTEASKSTTGQSDKENQSSSTKDKSQIHPSPSTPMVGEIHKETQQAAGGPTSLGSTDESEEEETERYEDTHTTSHDELEGTLIPHPLSLKSAQIQELMAQEKLKTLDTLLSILNKVTDTLQKFATVMENASGATGKSVPSAGIDVVEEYHKKKLLYDKYCDKMLKRRKSHKITNYDVLTKKGPIILKVYREDRTDEVISYFKVSDLHLAE